LGFSILIRHYPKSDAEDGNFYFDLDSHAKDIIYSNCINCINTVREGDVTMVLIDHKDRRPMYEQIIERFSQMILCGALQADTPMPSVRSLAMELSLNPNTIQRAYQELERMGYIYTIKGKGSFVSEAAAAADNKRKELLNELQAFTEKAFMAGLSPDTLREMLEQCIKEENEK
jgi:GntR family transcriptional regulator